MLEPVIGKNSVILLDEGDHLEQRKLMLPAFHGEKMQRLAGTMTEVAEREIDSWPEGEPLALHPRFQALTLEVILRAVFGLDAGARLDRLRVLLAQILELSGRPMSMLPFLQHELGGRTPWGRFVRLRAEADQLIHELIDERRASQRRPRRRALDAARGAPRGRLADDRAGAARRADDAAGRRPRDDGVAARLAVRVPGPRAARRRAPARRDRRRRRRRLCDGDRPGGVAALPGAPERRAAAGEAADRGRRLDLPARRLPDRQRLPDPPRPRRSTTTPTPSGPSASSTTRRAPTPGSRSAAGAGAASARASRCSR